MTIEAEVIKRRNQVSPTNFDRLLKESAHDALLRPFHTDVEANEAKEEKKRSFLTDTVPRKVAETSLDSGIIQTAITQFIRETFKDAITDAEDKRHSSMLAYKMELDDKPTKYPEGSRTSERPIYIVIVGQ